MGQSYAQQQQHQQQQQQRNSQFEPSSIGSTSSFHPSRSASSRKGTGFHHPYSRNGSTTPLEAPPSPWEVQGSYPFINAQAGLSSSMGQSRMAGMPGLSNLNAAATMMMEGGDAERPYAQGMPSQTNGLPSDPGPEGTEWMNAMFNQQDVVGPTEQVASGATTPQPDFNDLINFMSPEFIALLNSTEGAEMSDEAVAAAINGFVQAGGFANEPSAPEANVAPASSAKIQPAPIPMPIPNPDAGPSGQSLLSRRMQQPQGGMASQRQSGAAQQANSMAPPKQRRPPQGIQPINTQLTELSASVPNASPVSVGGHIAHTPLSGGYPSSGPYSQSFGYIPGTFQPAAANPGSWGTNRNTNNLPAKSKPSNAYASSSSSTAQSTRLQSSATSQPRHVPNPSAKPLKSALSNSLNASASTSPVSASPQGTASRTVRLTDAPSRSSAESRNTKPNDSDQLPSLPPLPEGFSLENLAQYGNAGLELAIRIGMGIGLSLSQTNNGQSREASVDPNAMQKRLNELLQQPPIASSLSASPNPSNPLLSPLSPSAAPMAVAAGMATNGSKSTELVQGILNDDFFTNRVPSTPGATPALMGGNGGISSIPTSRRTSNSGELPIVSPVMPSLGGFTSVEQADQIEESAKKDPLATQVWKAYAKAKTGMPSGTRMENLTWRLMHLTLKKNETAKVKSPMDFVREEDEAAFAEARDIPGDIAPEDVERGRRGRFKGKGRVVGFDAESPQGQQQDE